VSTENNLQWASDLEKGVQTFRSAVRADPQFVDAACALRSLQLGGTSRRSRHYALKGFYVIPFYNLQLSWIQETRLRKMKLPAQTANLR
jgi:hypothetical protein